MAAGAPARAGGSGPWGRPGCRAARIWQITAGSAMVAITRIRPPQRGHANTSSANARRMRAAHGQLRGAGGGAAEVSAAAAASGAGRP